MGAIIGVITRFARMMAAAVRLVPCGVVPRRWMVVVMRLRVNGNVARSRSACLECTTQNGETIPPPQAHVIKVNACVKARPLSLVNVRRARSGTTSFAEVVAAKILISSTEWKLEILSPL